MEAAIPRLLQTIEIQEQVRILYACESGSRAWGFASHDSDYDVRSLFVRPPTAYLRLDGPRDVIERPIVDDLDVSGWDIFKALTLEQVQLQEEVLVHIHNLVGRKQVGDELGLEKPGALLNTFSEEQLDKWSKKSFDAGDQKALSQELENVLQRILAEGER